jgi:hypothetical protein
MVSAAPEHAGRPAALLGAGQLALLGLALPVPDHTTLSRRGRAFAGLQARVKASTGPTHLVLDSTGLELFGQGEWCAAKRGRYSDASCIWAWTPAPARSQRTC